ncbi:hypothetical protein DACRYDRAFT_16097 [Dacryopinax primogenitus]|uniref:Uncharacterized protein n=1 Tax=Dacryopinax primogenitus (strain DJM 731) TaxID=1858805 RepID=M5FZR4_DACPD|nr:uncharacterized protein DACRYDRAFT_16097 [Dacryopinax primogenitus]EJU01380.1 hypothetical protein DACRYDRAFT_16097 [Dacryopinax primogenitus]
MQFYPVVGSTELREFWHGSLWAYKSSDACMTPMLQHESRPWFVDELVMCEDGNFFLPKRWVQIGSVNGEMGAFGHNIRLELIGPFSPIGESYIVPSVLHPDLAVRKFRLAKTFTYNWYELKDYIATGVLSFEEQYSELACRMPNPWRQKANGRHVYSLPLMIWEDDVSGNRSKQWYKHYNVCASNLAMPRQDMEVSSNILFLGTSPHATALELMEGLVIMLEELNLDGREAFDAVVEAPVLFTAWIAVLAGDNPMQSDLCSHRGLRANHFCRQCHAGGSQEFKRTPEGYASLFKTLAQCMPFILWDLVSADVLEAWVVIGLAGALLWQYDIEVKETYLDELRLAVTTLVHAMARLNPIKMISKPKMHILLHIVDNVRRFGPAVGFATERYESYNSVFRTRSVNSNHQAPSRDIATSFAHLDRVTHIINGRRWQDKQTGEYRAASPALLAELTVLRPLMKAIGCLVDEAPDARGFIQSSQPHSVIRLRDSAAHQHRPSLRGGDSRVSRGQSMIALNGDKVPVGAFVIFFSSVRRDKGLARVTEMLIPDTQDPAASGLPRPGMILLEIFGIGSPHESLGCPRLVSTGDFQVCIPQTSNRRSCAASMSSTTVLWEGVDRWTFDHDCKNEK